MTSIVCHKVKVTAGLKKKSLAEFFSSLQMMWGGASGKTVYHTLIVCHKVKVTAGLKLDKKSFADLSLQMMWGGASAQTVYTSHLSRSSTTAEVATILFHQQQIRIFVIIIITTPQLQK